MRKKSDQTRRKIVESAYYLFYRKGFVRVNVDEVAARAGITKRTLYSYFRSKDDLLAAALLHYSALDLERLRVIGARMPPTRGAKIDSFFGQLVEWAGHAALDRLRLHARLPSSWPIFRGILRAPLGAARNYRPSIG